MALCLVPFPLLSPTCSSFPPYLPSMAYTFLVPSCISSPLCFILHTVPRYLSSLLVFSRHQSLLPKPRLLLPTSTPHTPSHPIPLSMHPHNLPTVPSTQRYLSVSYPLTRVIAPPVPPRALNDRLPHPPALVEELIRRRKLTSGFVLRVQEHIGCPGDVAGHMEPLGIASFVVVVPDGGVTCGVGGYAEGRYLTSTFPGRRRRLTGISWVILSLGGGAEVV